MMAYNFPSSPTEGQQFTPPGGPTYVYNAPVWKLSVGSGAATCIVSDTPPSSATTGQLWWESDTGNLFTWYDDGTSKQWVQINVPNVSGLSVSQVRNRIVNPAFQISQENGSTAVGAYGSFPADQWMLGFVGITAPFAQRVPGTTLDGSKSMLSTGYPTPKPSLAAGDYSLISQSLEGIRVADLQWGGGGAKPMILRFTCQGQAAGTFSVSIHNNALTRCWVGNFTIPIANTWYKRTLLIPGDTTGVWPTDNTQWGIVTFCHATGTTYVAPAAGWNAGNFLAAPGNTNGAALASTYIIADIGFYVDDGSGLPPPWELPDEPDELLRCNRYWTKGNMFYQTPSAGSLIVSRPYRVPMRVSPTVAIGARSESGVASLVVNSGGPDEVNFQVSTTTVGGYSSFAYTASARL